MVEKETVKFMTREQLEAACNRAYAMNLNAQLEFKHIPDVPVGYPVEIAIPDDNVDNVRISLVLDDQGRTGLLDINHETYKTLSEFFLEDGELIGIKVGDIYEPIEGE